MLLSSTLISIISHELVDGLRAQVPILQARSLRMEEVDELEDLGVIL